MESDFQCLAVIRECSWCKFVLQKTQKTDSCTRLKAHPLWDIEICCGHLSIVVVVGPPAAYVCTTLCSVPTGPVRSEEEHSDLEWLLNVDVCVR